MDACGPDRCKGSEPAAFVVWKPRRSEYQRCDDSGCSTYAPDVAYSGSFTNITLPGHAVLFKLSTDRHYTEVVQVMDTTLVYRGMCGRA